MVLLYSLFMRDSTLRPLVAFRKFLEGDLQYQGNKKVEPEKKEVPAEKIAEIKALMETYGADENAIQRISGIVGIEVNSVAEVIRIADIEKKKG
jgi:hypothetical protein